MWPTRAKAKAYRAIVGDNDAHEWYGEHEHSPYVVIVHKQAAAEAEVTRSTKRKRSRRVASEIHTTTSTTSVAGKAKTVSSSGNATASTSTKQVEKKEDDKKQKEELQAQPKPLQPNLQCIEQLSCLLERLSTALSTPLKFVAARDTYTSAQDLSNAIVALKKKKKSEKQVAVLCREDDRWMLLVHIGAAWHVVWCAEENESRKSPLWHTVDKQFGARTVHHHHYYCTPVDDAQHGRHTRAARVGVDAAQLASDHTIRLFCAMGDG